MAIMIPENPREYKPESLEGVMFNALSKMEGDYYVIHSFRFTHVSDNVLKEGEADFVVFNPHKGILFIEAKAGAVSYEMGSWKYSSGDDMKHGGPYNQASGNKYDLLETMKNSSLKDVAKRCKFLHAVWFPSIDNSKLSKINFPREFEKSITLTKEDLVNPQAKIDSIFDLELDFPVHTDLSENDTKRILREVLCPFFSIFPSNSFNNDLKKIEFNRLLDEQKCILKFLIEQKCAVINGAAGTGKTMIAKEKALDAAIRGERVLFLCYNAFLCQHLEKEFPHELIDYMTIDKFVCLLCHSDVQDYRSAGEKIEDMYLTGTFPYVHVIVDEGQDFGRGKIEESNLLQIIHNTVVDNDEVNGTFYVFYDKLQMVQSDVIPEYIQEADCKLTLYRNCRNTENIAKTSLKPISERSPKLFEGAVMGAPARMHFCDSDTVIKRIDTIIEDLDKEGLSDIVILTAKDEKHSVLSGKAVDGKYRKKLFTTCRKFKGLEADAVIMVDVDENTFEKDAVQIFYVGASRACIRLEIVSVMDDDACCAVLSDVIKYNKKIKNPKRDFASALNAVPVVE